MRLLEYQGKELFDKYGIRIPKAILVTKLQEAEEAAAKLGYPVVLKAQLTVGGRGKAGAILKCKTATDIEINFNQLISKEIKGEFPRGILVEELVNIEKELYLSLFLDRTKRCYSLIVSAEGGVDIEKVGKKVIIDLPLDGLSELAAKEIALKIGLSSNTAVSFIDFSTKLSELVKGEEAELAEVNPLAVLRDGSIMALDAKVIIDNNALFRHPDLKKYEQISQLEMQAEKNGFSLVELNGNIAIIGNGAGLVMSTLDMVSDAGGEAGCFLDFGGRATTETIYEALKVISEIKKINIIFVNLFGGIVRTNLVAQAILDAYQHNLIDTPLFARISGAESDKAKEMLRGTKAKLYDTVEDAIIGLSQTISIMKEK
jgi:succinyl-CoA synthetase beta subunit